MCCWKHNCRCDISPVAGESYFEYLICCTCSLIINAFMPADLEACFDSSSETCVIYLVLFLKMQKMLPVKFQAVQEMVEDDVFELTRTESTRMRKCETEKVQKYFDDYYVVYQDPCAGCPGSKQQTSSMLLRDKS